MRVLILSQYCWPEVDHKCLPLAKEFKKNASIVDATQIDMLKSNAIKGLANYLMLESSMKDEKLQRNVAKYLKSETSSIKTHDDLTRPSTNSP